MPSTKIKVGSKTLSDGGYFDSHCHLNDLKNLPDKFQQAQTHGIQHFIIPGTEPDQWPEVYATQSAFPNTYAAIGTHPWFVKNPEKEAEKLEAAINNHSVIAIGEIGLDYYQGEPQRPDKPLQQQAFKLQLALAKKYHLPVIIHSVKAHQDCLLMLKQFPNVAGVIHAFSGSYEIAQAYTGLGFKLGIGPLLLRSKKLQAAIARVSLEHLLLETDAPYMTKTKALEGQSDNPLLQLIEVAKKLAELKSVPLEQVQLQSIKGACEVFKLI